MKEEQKNKWKQFGEDTYLAEIEKQNYYWSSDNSSPQGATPVSKRAFIHWPCPKSDWKAFGKPYGIYLEHICNRCGNVLPQEARQGEGFVKLMNAVQNYNT